MKLVKKISLIIIAVIGVIALVLIALAAFTQSPQELTADFKFIRKEKEDTPFDEPVDYSKELSELKQVAWIPYWDFDRGYQSLVDNKDKFSSVSPVWYEVNSDGSLKVLKRDSHKKLETFSKNNNILLVPTISMFDFEIIKEVLNNEENYDRHMTQILNAVDQNDYDGIDIDYESIELVDGDLFMKFIEELSDELKKRDKLLTMAVLSKWGDDITYPSLKETREVQDWEALSEYVDEIRIMAYDYTSTNSRYPGPIGPLLWIDDILAYAVEKVPREKVVLGAHLYAYEWVNEVYDSKTDVFTNPVEEKVQVNAYEYSDILAIKKAYQYEEFRDDSLGEVILEYKKNGTNRIVFYPDGKGVIMRKEIAAKYGINGVAYWRLGGEDDSGF